MIITVVIKSVFPIHLVVFASFVNECQGFELQIYISVQCTQQKNKTVHLKHG